MSSVVDLPNTVDGNIFLYADNAIITCCAKVLKQLSSKRKNQFDYAMDWATTYLLWPILMKLNLSLFNGNYLRVIDI